MFRNSKRKLNVDICERSGYLGAPTSVQVSSGLHSSDGV